MRIFSARLLPTMKTQIVVNIIAIKIKLLAIYEVRLVPKITGIVLILSNTSPGKSKISILSSRPAIYI